MTDDRDKRTPWKLPDIYGFAWKPIGSLIAAALTKADRKKQLEATSAPAALDVQEVAEERPADEV